MFRYITLPPLTLFSMETLPPKNVHMSLFREQTILFPSLGGSYEGLWHFGLYCLSTSFELLSHQTYNRTRYNKNCQQVSQMICTQFTHSSFTSIALQKDFPIYVLHYSFLLWKTIQFSKVRQNISWLKIESKQADPSLNASPGTFSTSMQPILSSAG